MSRKLFLWLEHLRRLEVHVFELGLLAPAALLHNDPWFHFLASFLCGDVAPEVVVFVSTLPPLLLKRVQIP